MIWRAVFSDGGQCLQSLKIKSDLDNYIDFELWFNAEHTNLTLISATIIL